jgi:hypothetical protein
MSKLPEIIMDREKIRRLIIGLGIILAVWFLFIQNGGDTITILNRSSKDICEVYFAFDPVENGWGRNQIFSELKRTHSRDIRMPIYFEWFAGTPTAGYSGRVVDCEGNQLQVKEGMGIDSNFYIWEVR